MKQLVVGFVAVLSLSPAWADAESLSYSYLEVGALQRDTDGIDSGDGVAAHGSVALGEDWHVFAAYDRSDHDLTDLSYTHVGFGYRLPLNESWDMLARVSYEEADFDFLGDGDGHGIEVAVRGAIGPAFEIEAGVRQRDLDIVGDLICIAIFPTPRPCAFPREQNGRDTSGFISAQWKFNDDWGLVGSFSSSERGTQGFVGPRWTF